MEMTREMKEQFGVLFFAGFLAQLFSPVRVQAAEPDTPRNILVIVADDHALDVTGVYGNKIIKTPSIDRLAGQGVRFSRAYCNSPICSASRQSLLTGKYPHSTGVSLLFTPFPDEGNTTIAEHLKKSGYSTAVIGKTHWNNWVWWPLYENGLPTHGFDRVVEKSDYRNYFKSLNPDPLPEAEYYVPGKVGQSDMAAWMNSKALPQRVRDENSVGTYFANEAIEFMKTHRDEPFFVWLAFTEPHHPYMFPVEYRGMYNPDDMPLPEGSPEDDRWIPECFRGLSDAEKRGIIAAYYTSTTYMDKNIGLVLDALDSMELTDDTLVVYLSDNGYLLNDHKRFEKHTMWEEAVRQPMIFRMPGCENRGVTSDALVEYIDVVPTMLDCLNLPGLEEAQGRSFASLLKTPGETHRETAFATYLQDNLAMICTPKWKYVFHTGSRDLGIGYATGYGPSGIQHHLYDLVNDPEERHSVADLSENQEILQSLQQQMLERFMQTHPDAANCPDGLTLEGKLVWFCEPRDIGDQQDLNAAPKRVFTD
jgi:arylsulfatase A-like enzyme